MKKGERGEVATLLTIAVLLVVGATTFVSSLALKGKKTVSTKAAVASSCPSGKCGSGCFYSCDKNEGYDTAICPTPYLEFACCVADNPNANSEYRIRFYGCTGQPCQNTKINNSLGYLVGCAGYNSNLHELKNFALINNTSVNFPTTSPTAKASATPIEQVAPGSTTLKPTVIPSQTSTTDPTVINNPGLTLTAALLTVTARTSVAPTTPVPTTKWCENNGGSCIFFYDKANPTNKNDICRVETQGNNQYDDSYKCKENNQECCIPITNIPKSPTPSVYSSSSPQPTSCGHLGEGRCLNGAPCQNQLEIMSYNNKQICTENCESNHGICDWGFAVNQYGLLPYKCNGADKCVLATQYLIRIASCDHTFPLEQGISRVADGLKQAYEGYGCRRCAYMMIDELCCWDCR